MPWVSPCPGTVEVFLPLRMPVRKRTWPSPAPVMPPHPLQTGLRSPLIAPLTQLTHEKGKDGVGKTDVWFSGLAEQFSPQPSRCSSYDLYVDPCGTVCNSKSLEEHKEYYLVMKKNQAAFHALLQTALHDPKQRQQRREAQLRVGERHPNVTWGAGQTPTAPKRNSQVASGDRTRWPGDRTERTPSP